MSAIDSRPVGLELYAGAAWGAVGGAMCADAAVVRFGY